MKNIIYKISPFEIARSSNQLPGKKKIQLGSVVFVYQQLCFLADLVYQLL